MKKFFVVLFTMLMTCNYTFAYQVDYINTGVPKRKASASFGSNAPWLNHKPSEFATRVKRDRCNTPAPYNYNGFKNNKKQVRF